jgi:hypothetical protein
MMSPIRHEDDFRRKQIDDWDSWIDEEIRKAGERGEFSNLPGEGKPLEIYRTDVNPEYDMAFSRLKNAGVMPAWMELDRDVRRLSDDLDAFLDRSIAYLADQRGQVLRQLQNTSGPEIPEQGPAYPRWQVWRPLLEWFRMPPAEADTGPATPADLIQLRDHMRDQYLARAARLDKKIADYHNALPRNLSNLQRLRLRPDRAAKRFNERCPPGFVLDMPAAPPDPPSEANDAADGA